MSERAQLLRELDQALNPETTYIPVSRYILPKFIIASELHLQKDFEAMMKSLYNALNVPREPEQLSFEFTYTNQV